MPKFKVDLMVGCMFPLNILLCPIRINILVAPPKTIWNWSREFTDLKLNASKSHAMAPIKL